MATLGNIVLSIIGFVGAIFFMAAVVQGILNEIELYKQKRRRRGL